MLPLLADLAALALLCTGFALVWMQYGDLPEKVPIHFGITGEPDSWGPRGTIWLLPAMSLVLYAMLTVIGMGRPPAPIGLMLGAIKVELLAMFLVIEYDQLRIARGQATRLGPGIWLILALLLLTPVVSQWVR